MSDEKAVDSQHPKDIGSAASQDKQETINMETHADHLHKSPGHGWKHYLFEFLMLFLAVTLGFFVENIREHYNEHQREREYIQSLVADLKNDQDVLTHHISHVSMGIAMMDSMINILNTPSQVANNTGELYFLARLAPRLMPLSTNDRTYEQLKNSGNFRLIDLATSNKIMAYYEKFPIIRLLESINETEFTEYKKAAAKIFYSAIFLKMEGNNDEIKRTSDNPPLQTTDKDLFQEFSAYAVYMHGTKKGILGNIEALKITGAELITYLQKEYQLK